MLREAGVQEPDQRYGAREINPKKPQLNLFPGEIFHCSSSGLARPLVVARLKQGRVCPSWIDSHVEEMSS